MTDFSQLIQNCEAWVRSGQTGLCVTALKKLNAGRVPSVYRRDLAVLARRIGQPHLGLRLLTPLFGEDFAGARPADLAEYAVLLQRCGANREALSRLERIPSAMVPEVSLYRAFAHFNAWEYEQAIPHLHEYVGAAISPYWRAVGRVNLADALIFTERTDEARELLERLVRELGPQHHGRLLGNCFEMLGQIHLLRGQLRRAEGFLNKSAALLGQVASLDRLYVSRWQAVLAALKASDPGPLLSFRDEASRRNEFESVRQADFFRLKLSFDHALFTHIYVGTPFAPYRAKLEKTFGSRPSVENYVWGEAPGRLLDVASATLDGRAAEIKGLKSHALLAELAKDFYRPRRVAEVFGALWPDEHFNIFSSPQRVHQLVARTRQWLAKENFDLRLMPSTAGYRISFGPGAAMLTPLEPPPALAYQNNLFELRKRTPEGFTKNQACAALGLSRAGFRRFCSWALQQGLVRKYGASSNTKYLFASAS